MEITNDNKKTSVCRRLHRSKADPISVAACSSKNMLTGQTVMVQNFRPVRRVAAKAKGVADLKRASKNVERRRLESLITVGTAAT